MKKNIGIALTILAIFIGSCSDGGDDPVPVPPAKAALIAPENNAECLDGNVLSAQQSEINFSWDAAANASSYIVHIKNAQNNATKELSSTNTSTKVSLARGYAYSWYVVSKNTTGQSAQSDTWRFYNTGEAATNYAPFPAEVVYPTAGASIAAGNTNLDWNGSDLDGDLVSYEVYMDTQTPPQEKIGTPSSSNYSVNVESGKTYYWYVVSLDRSGNRSNSEIFQFKVY